MSPCTLIRDVTSQKFLRFSFFSGFTISKVTFISFKSLFSFFIFSQLKFLPFDYPNHMKYFLHNYLSRYVHANQSRNILVDANVLEPNSAVDDWLKHDETPVLATFFSLLWRDLSFCSGPYFFIPGMKERLYIKPSGSLPSDRQVQFYI
jgi:hypothetical protein